LSCSRSGHESNGGRPTEPYLAERSPFRLLFLDLWRQSHVGRMPSPSKDAGEESSDRGRKRQRGQTAPRPSSERRLPPPTEFGGAWSTASLSEPFNDDDVPAPDIHSLRAHSTHGITYLRMVCTSLSASPEFGGEACRECRISVN